MPRAGIHTIHASEHPDFDNHEALYLIEDPKVDLLGIVAIHRLEHNPDLNQRIGCGGTRRRAYNSPNEFYKDALRLSAGMSRKSAWAETKSGGAKIVLWGDPSTPTHDDYWKSYAEVLNSFDGRVRTGEDVGVSMEVADKLRQWTPWVFGHSKGSGDPSPVTALGVRKGIEACLQEYKRDYPRVSDFYTFAIQGIGKVGYNLIQDLCGRGAKGFMADTNQQVVEEAKKKFSPYFIAVSPSEIHRCAADVFVPCAMGGVINKNTIPELRAKIVCGSANNQLATPEDGVALYNRGILYAPDYVVNAGGLMNVTDEFQKKGYNTHRATINVSRRIPENLRKIFLESIRTGEAPSVIADAEAKRIITSRNSTLRACEPVV